MSILNDVRVPASEITPKAVYLSRRALLGGAAGMVGGAFGAEAARLDAKTSPFSTDEKKTSLKDVTSYNNFYEFGVDKDDPAAKAGRLKTQPWTVKVDGLVNKPAEYHLEDLLKPSPLEERVYRMRCVEGWSMVIPWVGFPLAELIKRVDPLGSAKYVAFETLVRPDGDARARRPLQSARLALCRGPAARRGDAPARDPCRRPLRRDAAEPERCAASPRRALEVRVQGHQVDRPDQLRRQRSRRPPGTSRRRRNTASTRTSIPTVDHPRWSQATERRIGESGLFVKRRPTLMFNGYAEQVASLYSGMDLKRQY